MLCIPHSAVKMPVNFRHKYLKWIHKVYCRSVTLLLLYCQLCPSCESQRKSPLMGIYSFNTHHDRPCMEAQWIGTLKIQKARQSQSNLVTGQEQKALYEYSQTALKQSYGYKTFCSS